MRKIFLILTIFCSACGASPAAQHRTLNHITTVADPTYAMAVESCDVLRDVIVDRTGTTYEEDLAAMTEINRVCDAIVLGFESLRASQLTARAAIDSGAEGAVLQAIQEALRLWGTLQQMIPELQTLGTDDGLESPDPPDSEKPISGPCQGACYAEGAR